MPKPISEPDWKRFKSLRLLAIERFCNAVHKEAAAITASNEGTAHERYRELYQLMEKRDKEIVQLFDPHTRSRAVRQLVGLCRFGLVAENELNVFSDDMQSSVYSTIDLLYGSDVQWYENVR